MSVDVRMVGQPRTGCASAGHIGTDGNDLGHLKPTEQSVHRGRVPHVPPCSPRDLLGRSEPAEEQKEVTGADTLSLQVALRDVNLPKRWPPPGPTRKRTYLKIRVEMTAILAPDAATGQIFNEGSERAVAPSNVLKPPMTTMVGNSPLSGCRMLPICTLTCSAISSMAAFTIACSKSPSLSGLPLNSNRITNPV